MAFLVRGFVPCAGVAGFDVLVDELSDSRPGVISRDEFERLCFSLVSRCNRVVVSVEDVKLDSVVLWYVDKAVAEEQSVFMKGELFEV